MKARALMVGGTASHVGKSWMATAICRSLARRGFRVAPFKAQNMSNNSFPCDGGGEIGRAQVAQAEACFLAPEPDMNPILLKPNSDRGCQVVVLGKVWRNLSAREYYDEFPRLLDAVTGAYERLASQCEFIVIEGAGSIAELNLRATDLVNLGLATRMDVPVLLVADIDRGGVFASVAGTFALLEQQERALVRSFAINRFRGDPSLFDSGVEILEARTGKPCLGVFPYLSDAPLDPEDSVSLEDARSGESRSDVAVISFPRISNLSDFRLIPAARRIAAPADEHFACVILPGSKSTIADLAWLRARGLDRWIMDQHRRGALILGVCGGFQMMGERIEDPSAMESDAGAADGLGLLPVRTVLMTEKVTRRVRACTPSGINFEAYEIHLGETSRPRDAQPFAVLENGCPEGIRAGRCVGTYLHGALEHPDVLSELLGRMIEPVPTRYATYEILADWFETHADQDLFKELYLCS
jgi:adenosylcobyric acid synthase